MLGDARRCGVITGGTWCADHNKIVDFWPGEDELAEILSEEVRGGGSACNLAIDLRRLDPAFPVETIGIVGDDADGAILLAEADAHGIERSRLRVLPQVRTNYTDAFTSKRTGRRTHIFNPGTNALLSPEHFDFSTTHARYLHLGLPGIHRLMDAPWRGDANGWVAVLKQAQAAGIATNLELCSVPAERIAAVVRPCLAHLDLLIVNDYEICAIAGLATGSHGDTDVAACRAAAEAVMAAGTMQVLAVHFPAGAIALTRDGQVFQQPSVAVPHGAIVGANGAGDAFAAGVIYGLHEGWTIERSLALGHATSAASLRSLGTTDSVEDWQSCLALADRLGWRRLEARLAPAP